jgi:undecaprenyl-diphosphatase
MGHHPSQSLLISESEVARPHFVGHRRVRHNEDAMKQSVRDGPQRLLHWLGSHEMTVVLAIAGIAAGVWIFAALAGEVIEGDTLAFDRAVLLALRQPGTLAPLGPPAVQDAARDITALGGPAVLALVPLIAAGFLILDGKRNMALFVCGSVLSGLIVGTILKDVFQRPRPDLVPRVAYFSGASFPSAHSMMSAVTYLTLGALLARSQERTRLKAYFLLLAVLLTIAIGVTRVYLGVHWPTDVLAGWTAGAVWAVLCWLAARFLQERQTLERETEHALNSSA